MGGEAVSYTTPPFDEIRYMCEHDAYDMISNINLNDFAPHSQETWPTPTSTDGLPPNMIHIYNSVRSTGVPNCLASRLAIPSNLNLEAWAKYAMNTQGDRQLIDFARYGFPLGYLGPPSDTTHTNNHPSATNVSTHVDRFVAEELAEGAFQGPFKSAPFVEWSHVSPIMTRPKTGSTKRRVITDLTFPNPSSVNAYIIKNSALGEIKAHSLPTIADLVSILKEAPKGAHMFTVDIARAYRNFRSDPLDWPLLCIKWDGDHYVDVAMPFGSRASSCHMQRVAQFIMRILQAEGIYGAMYLDDFIIVSPDRATAHLQYHRVRALFAELGLPEATDKTQPPASCVRWLGVQIDAYNMSLSIPTEKVAEVLECANRFSQARSINKRQLQSLVGKLMHLAKCVEPARVFMAMLLDTLRAMGDRQYTRVNEAMKADLAWFVEFASTWNGSSLIPRGLPHKCIQVDACLTGVGGTDGRVAYATAIASDEDPVHNITEIEAANIVIALHTFVSDYDRGTCIAIQCDNKPAVDALNSARTHNAVLAECAQSVWMVEAMYDIKLLFFHIPGLDNPIADALSRAHTSAAYGTLADELVHKHGLSMVDPCTYILSFLNPSIKTRSGLQLASRQGGAATTGGEGTRHADGPPRSGARPGSIRPSLQDGHSTAHRGGRVPMGGAPHRERGITWNHQEQDLKCQGVHSPGGRKPTGNQPHPSDEGTRHGQPAQGLRAEQETPSPSGSAARGANCTARRSQRTDDKNRSAPHVLWGSAAIRGRAPHHGSMSTLSATSRGPTYQGATPWWSG